MKALLTLSLILLWSTTGYGAIHVADNNPNAPTGTNIHNSLSAAITAATTGDTIHVVPSTQNYGSVTIELKKLTLLGIGFNPLKDIPLKSQLSSITLSTGTHGTKISGLYMTSTISVSDSLNGVTVENCYLPSFNNSGHPSNDIVLKNNILTSYVSIYGASTSRRVTNVLITSNTHISGYMTIYHITGGSITNNIFYYSAPASGGTSLAFSSLEDCIVANNIFYGKPIGSSTSITRNTFNNNLIYRTAASGTVAADDFPTVNSNTESNNLKGVDPEFTNFPADGSTTVSINNIVSYDFRLGASSLGKNAGSDGTDVGIFGGQFPFNSILTGGTPIPFIERLNTAGVVKVGDNLSVSIKGKAAQ